jgi:hypothetical protein
MEQKWNDIDRRSVKGSEKNLYHCHFVHQKSLTNCSGSELGLLL